MSLCRLVYLSDATRQMTDGELEELVEHCRVSNDARGISGMLFYSGNHFLQVLEGDGMRVRSLFTQISRDLRHKNILRLSDKPMDHRMFAEWGMKLVNNNRSPLLDRDQMEATLLRLRIHQNESTASEAITLLNEFRRQVMKEAA